jgi:hypothetical protein
MKSLLNTIGFCSIITLLGCVSNRHSDSGPIKFSNPTPPPAMATAPAPQGVPMANCCPEEQDSMIPFTRDLYNRLRVSNQDVRKLQFFIDQTIILSRGLSQDKLYIDNGKIVNQYGVNGNKIELPALTPGVVEAIEPDGMRIAFEGGGNNLKFINNKYSPEFFAFSGTNWDNGTAEVPYRGTTYRASCATCGSVSEASLVVRRKDVNVGNTNANIIGGRTLK